jgi:uncharacterized protein (DUF305 family)
MKRFWWRTIAASLPSALLLACGGPRVAATPAVVSAMPPAADSGSRPHTPADVHFMGGMIAHHAQAVVMGGWATDSVHGAGLAVRAMSERIVVGQTDEIVFLERWLREHHEAPMVHHMQMPGMLSPEQMAQLDVARGPAFDRLFLTFMIQHHQGAITMVDELLGAPGAAQDGLVFRFAADVHADQTTEIERMRRMLAALPAGGTEQ